MDILETCQQEYKFGIALVALSDQGMLALLIVDLSVNSGNPFLEGLSFN